MTVVTEWLARVGDWVSMPGEGQTISPRGASGLTALLVVDNVSLTSGTAALRDILSDAGYDVEVRDLIEPEDYTGIAVVVMAYGNPKGDNGKYVNPPVGICGVDTWRPIGMGDDLGFASTVNSVEVVDTSSPLAAGVSGTFAPYLSAQFITWNTDLSASPDVVVTRPSEPGQAVVFGYEAGSTMPGRFATARHVGLGYHEDGLAAGLTTPARDQLVAAVEWARTSSYVTPPVPAVPAGVSASGQDGQVSLSWSAAQYAASYTVKRATTTGGPYTTVRSGVTSTSYTDRDVTNGTDYFYVVSAVNGSGESGNSAEVSATPEVSENVSLLATSAEITMWQDRAVNGPFKTAEDFATNSPGHWDEIVTDAARDWSAARWTGPQELTSSGAVEQLSSTDDPNNHPPDDTQNISWVLHSAAYKAVVDDDAVLAQAIIDEIKWYSQQTTLDFNDRTLYPYDYYDDQNPLFTYCIWVAQFAYAYDLCTAVVARDLDVENWFAGLADVAMQAVDAKMAGVFPNRQSDDYANRSSFVDSATDGSTRLANGSIVEHPSIGKYYNNRRSDNAGFGGFVGVLVGDTGLVDSFKRYFREVLMFSTRTTAGQETFGDHNRGDSAFPQLGLSYDFDGLIRMMPAVEALARQGDTELYEFSSSEGAAIPTWGSDHQKSVRDYFEQKFEFIAQSGTAHYSGSGDPVSSSVAGDEFYRVKAVRTGRNRILGHDGYLLMAAIYYNESSWVDAVLRVGTPDGYTSSPNNQGAITGWKVDGRHRFARSLSTRPDYGS